MLGDDWRGRSGLGGVAAAALLLASACAPHSTLMLRSGHEVHGEVLSGDSQSLIVEEHSGGHVRVDKCVVSDVSYAGKGRIIAGGILLGAATILTGGVSAFKIRDENDGYRSSSRNDDYAVGYLYAAAGAVTGGILLFTGLNQEATARERIGTLKCVPVEEPGLRELDLTRPGGSLPPTR